MKVNILAIVILEMALTLLLYVVAASQYNQFLGRGKIW